MHVAVITDDEYTCKSSNIILSICRRRSAVDPMPKHIVTTIASCYVVVSIGFSFGAEVEEHDSVVILWFVNHRDHF